MIGLDQFNWKYIITFKRWQKKTSQEVRLKNIDETKNYLIEEISWNELMSKKRKKKNTHTHTHTFLF